MERILRTGERRALGGSRGLHKLLGDKLLASVCQVFDLVVMVNSGVLGPVRGVGKMMVEVGSACWVLRGRPGPLLGAVVGA
jgi:hypothetical protein